jgi:hypothetical protein
VVVVVVLLLLVGNALIRGRTQILNAGRRRRKMRVVDVSYFEDPRFVWATMGISNKWLTPSLRCSRWFELDGSSG